MKQKTGNCYLIASLNIMRLNKYFMQDLYKNIDFVLWKSIYDSKIIYSFPDWEKVEIFLKDLKIQKDELQIKELEEIIEVFNKKDEKLNNNFLNSINLEEVDIVEEILMYIEKNKQKVAELLWEEKIEFYEDSRWRKKILFKKDFVEEIEEQIKNKTWEYYEYLLEDKKYLSVDAPLGYKILEALYIKKTFSSSDRKNAISWKSSRVFELFLDNDKWKKLNLVINFNKEKILDILYFFNSNPNNYIITVSIDKWNPSNTTPYFYYNNIKMSEWHAYSVVWFDKDKWEIEIVNPWDNNKSLFFSIDEFFKLFSGFSIAEKRDS